MSDTRSKLRALVESLYLNTISNKIDWEPSESAGGAIASIGNVKVEISEEPGQTFENDVRVTIYKINGEQIDTFDDNYLKGLNPKNVNMPSYYSLMTSLLESARRKASGADKVLDEILGALGGPIAIEDEGEDEVPF